MKKECFTLGIICYKHTEEKLSPSERADTVSVPAHAYTQ